VNFDKEIKPIINTLAQRVGIVGPSYDTPEGQQRVRTIRLMFRRGYISEKVARDRLEKLNMPPALINAIIEHELIEKRPTPSP